MIIFFIAFKHLALLAILATAVYAIPADRGEKCKKMAFYEIRHEIGLQNDPQIPYEIGQKIFFLKSGNLFFAVFLRKSISRPSEIVFIFV